MGLWDTFTGKTGKKQAAATLAANNATAQEGFGANQGYAQEGYGSATKRLDPYSQQGRTAGTARMNLLGLNGGDAQQGARTAYEGWNPYLSGDMDDASRAVDRRYAAMGQGSGGLGALARDRVVRQMGSQNFRDYDDRLAGLGGQGFQADGALAGIDTGYAQSRMGNQNMLSGQKMGNQNAYSQAYTQADTAGLQNMIGLGTTAAQMFMGMPPTGKQPAYSQPGTAANGGWSTTATPAGGNNFANWFGWK